MPHPRLILRRIIIAACVALTCFQAHAGHRPEDRKGRFVRVITPASVMVMRFNREYFFTLLGVEPLIAFDPSDPLNREATKFLTTLLTDQRLVLALDEAAPNSVTGRESIGYLFLKDGTFVNAEMLKRGYGRVDHRAWFARREEFERYEEEARASGRGLWGRPEPPEVSCDDLTIGIPGTCGVTYPLLDEESRVNPTYPKGARKRGVEGRVVLAVVVLRDGGVDRIKPISSPDTDLTEAAIDAVEQWHYSPARRDGRPIDAYFTVVVDFILTRKR
ncbi:MAG TPA: TonB family protein [Candidatus Polarisedimenticolia bacterium]|nr:TonB family protein [Candidatus Polarisedimenticolia bacterium]